jgi:hypothetical protein
MMAPEVQATVVKVKIEGAYSNGHTYKRVVEVPEPTEFPRSEELARLGLTETDPKWWKEWLDEWWDEWWEEFVFPETGDGVFGKVGHNAEAKITEATNPALVGLSHEWDS